MSQTDRSLHILLHLLAVLDGRRVGQCDPMEIFQELSEQIADLSHNELVAAAHRAEEIRRDLRGLARRIERSAFPKPRITR
jgi:hypothetical protein